MDDATGIVANAVFRQAEDTRGYFILMDGLIRRWGIPLALYTDRHGVFKFSGRPRHYLGPSNQPISPAACGSWVCS